MFAMINSNRNGVISGRHRCQHLPGGARPPTFMQMWKDPAEAIGWGVIVATARRPTSLVSWTELVQQAPVTDDGIPMLDETVHQRVVAGPVRRRDVGQYSLGVRSPRAALRPLDEDIVRHDPADDDDPLALYRPDPSRRLNTCCPRCGRPLPVTLRHMVSLAVTALERGDTDVTI